VRERSRQQRIQSKKQQQWNTWAYNRNRDTITYNSSVDIRPDWAILEQVGPAGCWEQQHVIRYTLNPRLSSETASCDMESNVRAALHVIRRTLNPRLSSEMASCDVESNRVCQIMGGTRHPTHFEPSSVE
jgi:hypothetical protein